MRSIPPPHAVERLSRPSHGVTIERRDHRNGEATDLVERAFRVVGHLRSTLEGVDRGEVT
jgi:hypothetical protein